MLVATPGQTATYHPMLHSGNGTGGGSGGPKNCHNSSSSTLASTSSVIGKLPAESSSANSSTSNLMKTLSVRLNRGTEFLKGTVQRALISTTSSIAAAHSNSKHFNSSNIVKRASNAVAAVSATNATSLSTNGNGVNSASKHAPATISKFLKLYTVPPTVIHRQPEERLQTSSVDSLHKEMCHFKPIRTAPTTPWKCGSKSRGASLKIPKANLATKVDLHLNCDEPVILVDNDDDDNDHVDDGNVNGNGDDDDDDVHDNYNAAERNGNLQAQNNKVKNKKRKTEILNSSRQNKPKSGSNLLSAKISNPTHKSAFICLVTQMKTLGAMSKSKASLKVMDLHKTKSKRGRPKLSGAKRRRGTLSLVNTATEGTNTDFEDFPTAKASTSTTVNTMLRKNLMLRKRKNPFVNVKKLHLPTDLIIGRNFRNIPKAQLSANVKAKAPSPEPSDVCMNVKKKNNQSINQKPINWTADLTNAKSKAALNSTKSTMLNIVNLMQDQYQPHASGAPLHGVSTTTAFATRTMSASSRTVATSTETQRKGRKRKAAYVFIDPEEDRAPPVARKRIRNLKDCISQATIAPKPSSYRTAGSSNASPKDTKILWKSFSRRKVANKDVKQSRIVKKKKNKKSEMARCTPPLTRSRLKQMSNAKLMDALDYQHRTI